jgi:hypothetical protein
MKRMKRAMNSRIVNSKPPNNIAPMPYIANHYLL